MGRVGRLGGAMPRLTVVAEFKVPQYITADEAVNLIRVEGGSESSRAYRILSTGGH